MGVPELLFPLTSEQRAVARRVAEVGAGKLLEEHANVCEESQREDLARLDEQQ